MYRWLIIFLVLLCGCVHTEYVRKIPCNISVRTEEGTFKILEKDGPDHWTLYDIEDMQGDILFYNYIDPDVVSNDIIE